MAIDLAPELLDILACPNCHGSLAVDHDRDELVCLAADCGLAYPVRQGIPVLLIDEARRPGPDLPSSASSAASAGSPGSGGAPGAAGAPGSAAAAGPGGSTGSAASGSPVNSTAADSSTADSSSTDSSSTDSSTTVDSSGSGLSGAPDPTTGTSEAGDERR